jgi:hypothetical protein
MNRPNFYITEETFRALIGPSYWAIQDLPPARAEQVRPFLNSGDTLGVFACGIPPQAAVSEEKVGGIDWVRLESRPKAEEPPLNVYHYVIKRPDAFGYPVFACREGGSIAPHWSEWENLEPYWEPPPDLER